MCGIAGVVRRDGAISPDPAAALGAALAHRGPDGDGVWRSPAHDVAARRIAAWRSSIPALPARSRWPRPTAVTASSSTAKSTTTASCGGRSRRAASGSRPAATPRCCCGCSPATVRAALARVRGMFALAWWDAERAHAAAGARSLRHQAAVCRGDRSRRSPSPPKFRRCSSSGLVERDDRSGRRPRISGVGHACRRSLTYVAGVESLAPGSWLRWSQDGGCDAAAVRGRRRGLRAPADSGCTRRGTARARGRRRAAERRRAPGRRRAGRRLPVRRHRFVGDSLGRVGGRCRRPQHLHRAVRRSIVRARVRAAGRFDVRRDASRAGPRCIADRRATCRAFSRGSISRRSTR